MASLVIAEPAGFLMPSVGKRNPGLSEVGVSFGEAEEVIDEPSVC
jgi:hypothetical protein